MAYIYWVDCIEDKYREMSKAAHSLLRRSVADKLSVSDEQIAILKDANGRPYIQGVNDIFVSLSHSKGTVMCAVSDKEIGVDVEMCSKRRKTVESRVFTDRETSLIDKAENEDEAFYTLWTLKESYLKAIGTGFAGNAKSIEFYTLKNPIESSNTSYNFTVGKRNEFLFAVCEKK